MKYGEIYDCRNAEEAKHLIGKKVVASNYLRSIILNPDKCDTFVLFDINKEDDWPFLDTDNMWQFIREIKENQVKCPYYQGVCSLDESIVCYAMNHPDLCDKRKEHEKKKQMREISTKDIEIGEHVLIDGVEFVAEEDHGICEGCDMAGCGYCYLIPCINGLNLKRVKKQPTEKEYKVEKQDKDTLMTNQQLAEWCAKGCGQWKHSPSNSGTVYHTYWVIEDKEGCFVEDNVVIRPWGTDEWIIPTLEIYKRDCILKKIGPVIMEKIPEMPKGDINLCGLGGRVQSNT